MDEAEYARAVAQLYERVSELDDAELALAVVRAAAAGVSARERLLGSLEALRKEWTQEALGPQRVLDRLNTIVVTETGEPITEVLLELPDQNATRVGAPGIDLVRQGQALLGLVYELEDLMGEVAEDEGGSDGVG